MKNMTATIKATDTMTAIAAIHDAAKAAQKAYEEARDRMVQEIISQLPDDPATPVLNLDLARMAGVTPAHMASMMNAQGYRSGVATTTVEKVRRFVEVDEDGKIIEGGKVKETSSRVVAFYKDKGRRW